MAKGKIPIKEGRRLSETYQAPVVIVFSLHDGGDTFNVTTYGATKALCRHAASLGEQIAAKVLGGEISPEPLEPERLPNVPTEWEGKRTGGTP